MVPFSPFGKRTLPYPPKITKPRPRSTSRAPTLFPGRSTTFFPPSPSGSSSFVPPELLPSPPLFPAQQQRSVPFLPWVDRRREVVFFLFSENSEKTRLSPFPPVRPLSPPGEKGPPLPPFCFFFSKEREKISTKESVVLALSSPQGLESWPLPAQQKREVRALFLI